MTANPSPEEQAKAELMEIVGEITGAAKQNAVSHGITSTSPVIEGESREDWQRHLDGIRESLAPEGDLEDALAVPLPLTVSSAPRAELVLALAQLRVDGRTRSRALSFREMASARSHFVAGRCLRSPSLSQGPA